jgi:hypothetical protein
VTSAASVASSVNNHPHPPASTWRKNCCSNANLDHHAAAHLYALIVSLCLIWCNTHLCL